MSRNPGEKQQSPEKRQSQKFIDAAKELGADVDEETLRRALGKVTRHKAVDKDGESKDKGKKSG